MNAKTYIFHDDFFIEQNPFVTRVILTAVLGIELLFTVYCVVTFADEYERDWALLRGTARLASGAFLFIYALDILNFLIRNRYMQKVFELRTTFVMAMYLMFCIHVLTFLKFSIYENELQSFSPFIASGGVFGFLIVNVMFFSCLQHFSVHIKPSVFKLIQLWCMHFLFVLVCVVSLELLRLDREVAALGSTLFVLFFLRAYKAFAAQG